MKKNSEKAKEKTTVIRSLMLDVYPHAENDVERKALWLRIRRDFCTYRMTARRIAGMYFMALASGATLKEDKDGGLSVSPPAQDEMKAKLAAVFGKEGKAFLYEFRNEFCRLLKGWNTAQVDVLRLEVGSKMKAKDPHYAARREWLALQGVRLPPAMRHIGMTFKLAQTPLSKWTNHSVCLNWRTDALPIEFRWKRLDGSRWSILRRIIAGEIEFRQIELNLNDKDMRLRVPYVVPTKKAQGAKTLEVGFAPVLRGEGQFDDLKLVTRIRDAEITNPWSFVDQVHRGSLSTAAAVDMLDRLKWRSESTLYLRRACGSKRQMRRGEGLPKAAESYDAVLNRIACLRSRVQRDWNHRWSKAVVSDAIRWGCSTILVFDLPSQIRMRPWCWSEWLSQLQAKAEVEGITVEVTKSPKVEEQPDAAKPNG